MYSLCKGGPPPEKFGKSRMQEKPSTIFFDPAVRQHSRMKIGHEIISRAILPQLLFHVGQLSITGQKMYTKYWFISLVQCTSHCNHCH